MFSSRSVLGLMALICFLSLGFAYVLQYGFDQAPCDLCLLQRFCFYVVGIIALLGSLYKHGLWGRRLYGFITFIFSLGGLAAAGRQVYIQSLPEDLKPGCGPGLIFRLNHSPWLEALTQAIHGTGDCAAKGWTIFGMSLAFWAGALFLFLLGLSLWVLKIKKVAR